MFWKKIAVKKDRFGVKEKVQQQDFLLHNFKRSKDILVEVNSFYAFLEQLKNREERAVLHNKLLEAYKELINILEMLLRKSFFKKTYKYNSTLILEWSRDMRNILKKPIFSEAIQEEQSLLLNLLEAVDIQTENL